MFDKASDQSIRPRFLIYDVMQFEVCCFDLFCCVLCVHLHRVIVMLLNAITKHVSSALTKN